MRHRTKTRPPRCEPIRPRPGPPLNGGESARLTMASQARAQLDGLRTGDGLLFHSTDFGSAMTEIFTDSLDVEGRLDLVRFGSRSNDEGRGLSPIRQNIRRITR